MLPLLALKRQQAEMSSSCPRRVSLGIVVQRTLRLQKVSASEQTIGSSGGGALLDTRRFKRLWMTNDGAGVLSALASAPAFQTLGVTIEIK